MDRGCPSTDESRRQGVELVLERIRDLKELLTNDSRNPILRLVEQCAAESGLGADSQQIAAAFRHCVLDLLRGRVRRLEDELSMFLRDQPGAVDSGSSPTILLVEDDVTWIEIGKFSLEESGYRVAAASSADELAEALRHGTPALVLMDIHLGSENGLQLIRCIRKGTVCPDVPIIIVTADRQKETVKSAAHLGVQDYLLKPYQPADLLAKVRKHVPLASLAGPIPFPAIPQYIE